MGQAALLTSLVIPEVDDISYRDWYLNQLVTFAFPFYEPIKFLEPAVGSGIMILGHASSCPEWAVMRNLIQYSAVDIDLSCVMLTTANVRLYGLNGYGLQLTAAVAEAQQLWQERQKNLKSIEEQNPAAVYETDDSSAPSPNGSSKPEQTLELLFRTAATSRATQEVEVPVPA